MRRIQTDFEKELDRQTLERITQMELPDYPFPPRFSRGDYLLWAAVTLTCLVLLVVGARL